MNEPTYTDPYNPYNQNYGESSLVQQTNPKEVLFQIEMALRGKIEQVNEDGRTEWILPIGCKPIVNQQGINSLMADAKSVINQNTILSNYDDEQISKLIVRLGKSVNRKIKMNWKDFGIDKSNLDTAVFAVTDPAYAALHRAKKEGEKKFLKTSVRAVESYVTNQKDQNQTSSSDKIKFWRD